jgi:hypothetical protein
MSQITEHFTWEDVTHSSVGMRTGIDNMLPVALKPAALSTALYLEKVRAVLGRPIYIDSWYRCLALNKLLGSKSTSQHLKCEAVDFVCPEFGTPVQICKAIIASGISFDQLILEHSWVHISFKADPRVSNRNLVLSLLSDGTYSNGLTDKTGKSYV